MFLDQCVWRRVAKFADKRPTDMGSACPCAHFCESEFKKSLRERREGAYLSFLSDDAARAAVWKARVIVVPNCRDREREREMPLPANAWDPRSVNLCMFELADALHAGLLDRDRLAAAADTLSALHEFRLLLGETDTAAKIVDLVSSHAKLAECSAASLVRALASAAGHTRWEYGAHTKAELFHKLMSVADESTK